MSADIDTVEDLAFWVGEWDVQNRILEADGTWSDTDRARVRIAPFIDEQVLLEEWVGPFFGETMYGFSLRARRPDSDEWHLVLFWTTSGDGAFMEFAGAFRHGRGEFFAAAGDITTRYTFSDISADSLRWDSATSIEPGVWRTDWIMEFIRTANHAPPQRNFDTTWASGELSSYRRARLVDPLLGTWSGRDDTGQTVEYSCAAINRDCLVVESLSAGTDPGDSDQELLSVSGWVDTLGEWQSWTAYSTNPSLRSATLTYRVGQICHVTRDDRSRRTTSLDGDTLTLHLDERSDPGSEWETTLHVLLRRDPAVVSTIGT